MVVLALVSLAVSWFRPDAAGWVWGGTLAAAVTTVLLYLLGWRARDRATGVIAGLLLATSLPFSTHAAIPREALFALLIVASLLSFVAGSSLLALTFAGLATLARPDALLLGLLLLGLSIAQGRRRWPLGGLAFLVIVVAGWGAMLSLRHQLPPSLHVGPRDWLWAWACAPGMALVTWLLLPFCAELGEQPRRARWLPVVLWAVLSLAVGSFVRVGDREATVFGLMPVWFVMAAGGLSRLLPALTEIPVPWARYLLAAVAVLSLLGMRLRAEWPHSPQRAHVAAPASVLAAPHSVLAPAAAAAIPVAAVAALHHAAASPAPPSKPTVKSTPKPAASHSGSATKPQPKPAARKAMAPPPRPRPLVRTRAVYRRYYRPRQGYRRYYRRY